MPCTDDLFLAGKRSEFLDIDIHREDCTQRIQGRDAVKEYLLANPEICNNIEQQIRDNAYKLMSPQARKAAQAAGRAVDVSADDFEG